MATKSWPSLESCSEARPIGEENDDDHLSELPEEILMSVTSLFTMKEAARFSLVSRQCEVIWRYFPVLIFEDYQVNFDNHDQLVENKACFVRRVDRVIEKHLGTAIDELRITSDLEPSWQSYVDKWVAVALDKQVKRLELNFSPIRRILRGIYSIYYGCHHLDLPPKLTAGCFKSSFLTSLCLRHVNVNDEFVDFLPHSCPLLEMLCIEGSTPLTRVTGSLDLKQLEVSFCKNLKRIDISAPKLGSLTLDRLLPVELLRIVDAPSLVEMSIGLAQILPYPCDYLEDNLEDILPQLVYLNLRIQLELPFLCGLMNGVAMPKLEHLELQVLYPMVNSGLLGCTSVIAASPSLQKLTLKLEEFIPEEGYGRGRELNKWEGYGFPIKCLKTLEIVGYRGELVDLELAFFVIDNASMLEEIVLDFAPLDDHDKRQRRLEMLQTKL